MVDMTNAILLHLCEDPHVDLELAPISVSALIDKDIQAVRDDGNVIRVVDSGRSQRRWLISALLSGADMETLIIYYRSKTTATNPKVRIYDKSTTPYYNEYLVYFAGYDTPQWQPGAGGKWLIKLTLEERTA